MRLIWWTVTKEGWNVDLLKICNLDDPSEASGITIEGNDKILTMIQSAAKHID